MLRVPRRVSSWVSILSIGLFLTRFVVLFSESWSMVRSERAADATLLRMCSQGVADESPKFRSLCIQARADQAAPLLFKVTLRSIRTAFSDFLETFHSPTRVALLVLFCVSGLALPVVKAISAIVASHLNHDPLKSIRGRKRRSRGGYGDDKDGDDDYNDDSQDHEACSVVVLEGGRTRNVYESMRALPYRMARRRAIPMLSSMNVIPEQYSVGDGMAPGGSSWQSIDCTD